jgi:hypothetical protein
LQVHFTDLYNSKNLGDIEGHTYDTVVCATVPAVKWMAIKEPEADKACIDAIIAKLDKVVVDKQFVLISTIDVHPTLTGANEDTDCSANEGHHAYGANRRYFEEWCVKKFGDKCTIVRLPALFGPGLKKNYIYDLLNDNLGAWIKQNTLFQWYPLVWLWRDITKALAANVRLVNLFPEPVHTSDIVNRYVVLLCFCLTSSFLSCCVIVHTHLTTDQCGNACVHPYIQFLPGSAAQACAHAGRPGGKGDAGHDV